MAAVDSLEVIIETKAQDTAKSLNNLVKQLGLIAEGISSIGSNTGLNEFAKKAQEATKNFANIQNAAKGLSNSITPEMQKVSKSFDEIAAKYKDLGKGFKFVGSTSAIQKQIDSYTNALEKAKLKKDELEAGGKTGGQGYEDAIRDIQKYENVLESLKKQLAEMQAGKISFNTSGIENAENLIERMKEQIRQSMEGVRIENPIDLASLSEEDFSMFVRLKSEMERAGMAAEQMGGQIREAVNIPASAFNLNSNAMAATFGEAERNIENMSQAAQVFGENAGQALNDLPNPEIRINGIEEAGNKLREFGERLNQLVVPEIREDNLDKLQSSLSKTESKLEELRTKLENGLTMGHITESVDDSGFVRLQEQIAYTEKQVEALRNKIAEVGNSGGAGGIERFQTALSKLSAVGKTAISALSGVASAIKKMGSVIGTAISKVASLGKSFLGLGKSSKSTSVSLAGGFKTILKYTLGIRSLHTLFNKLSKAAKEAFQNLAQYSPETNAAISSMKSSLDALKNSLAAAFAPILNVVAPYISAFIDMLTKAFNAAGRLFAALTGKSFAVQAKKTYTDYAASVSGAGKATKKAGKDVQQGIRAFDELKTISINKDEEADSGGGGGAGASPADMFTDVPIDSEISDFAQKLKDAWAKADFAEISEILGIKFKNALDGINWGPIKETAAKIGKSIGTLINGFVEVDGLADSIGRTIGEAINTGITGINTFLDSTHWDSVGIFIGEGLNGIVNTVDWKGLGHLFAAKFNAIFEVLGNIVTTFDWSNFGLQLATSVNTFITDFDWAQNGARLGELAKGLLDSIISFLENTDWQALGNGIADFIGSIDWGGILERLAEGIGAALGGLAALLWGLIEEAWNSVVTWWQETAFEDGQFTITGLLNGIWEGIKNIGTWIYEHIFQPFIDGFKKAFGIASPSKVMEEQGNFLMQGLFGGISSLVKKVVGVFVEIKNKIVGIWDTLKTKTGEIWEGIKGVIKTPINAIIGFINGLVGGVAGGINGLINLLNKLSFDVPGWVTALTGIETFGFNIPNITAPQIPYLAKGAVFKGGNPFLAVVNDQKRGQTNVETPLKVIQEALREELTKFSLNIQAAVPNTMTLNYSAAPVPSYAGAYGNYQYETKAYATSRNSGNSEMARAIESAVYRATYNAVSSAINNSKTLGDIKDSVEKGHDLVLDDGVIAGRTRKIANAYTHSQGEPFFDI